jgi:hypothetical protein
MPVLDAVDLNQLDPPSDSTLPDTRPQDQRRSQQKKSSRQELQLEAPTPSQQLLFALSAEPLSAIAT